MPTQDQTGLDLSARYGRTRKSTSRRRLIFGVSAAAFVLVFAAWLIWGGLLGAPAQLEAKDTGHVVVDDSLTQVRFELTVDPGVAVRCAVQALNSSFSIVGWKLVTIEPGEQRTRSITEEVRTTERAVTGLIYRCWLA